MNTQAKTTFEYSKMNAYKLFDYQASGNIEIGTIKGLVQIHAFLFCGLCDFAGRIRDKNISKGGFMFADQKYLPKTLKTIERMPDTNFEEILSKYVELNIAHPFMDGNGRATRIWLDMLLRDRIGKCVDWKKIDKEDYLDAMQKSIVDTEPIQLLLKRALTSKINDREVYMKGIDNSYYYEAEHMANELKK